MFSFLRDIKWKSEVDKKLFIYKDSSNLHGIIKRNEIQVKAKYKILHYLKNGIFVANGSHLIDSKGELIGNNTFSEYYGDFENDRIIIQQNERFYTLDSKGKKVERLPNYSNIFKYDLFNPASKFPIEHRNTFLMTINGTHRENADIIYCEDLHYHFTGKWGLINSVGLIILPPKYDYISFLSNSNYFLIFQGEREYNSDSEYLTLENNSCGIIDRDENIVIPTIYTWIYELDLNKWAVNIGGAVYFSDDYQVDEWTVKGGKWGVVNHLNEIVVPIIHDEMVVK